MTDKPVIVERKTKPLSDKARKYLHNQDSTNYHVWVFFRDKAVFTQTQFDNLANKIKLTERSLNRRKKVNADKIFYIDLPVEKSYIRIIENLGAYHRISSRWLNAASFTVPSQLIDKVANLPFVVEIRPLASVEKINIESISESRFESPRLAQAPDVLSYGNSFGQLSLIKIPEMHNRGYSGTGVTLTMIDSGFRKSHQAFALHYQENRVLAEYDFILDNPVIGTEGSYHGTSTWSTAAAFVEGVMYGPAYKANYILCRTVDFTNDYPEQEDFWMAAVEFADSIGTDVISSSLGYGPWYSYQDYDGETATITLAANLCDGLGIVLCNAMGNQGPDPATLFAPADAFNMLAVGAVTNTGMLTSFSARGPTYNSGNGSRIKPEVCAQGADAFVASATGDNDYRTGSGTSVATPLVAGAACLLIEAHPTWNPRMIREALMLTASNAMTPDNNYGWGIVDADAAFAYQHGPCCVGIVGNVDNDPNEDVDIGDITKLIDYLFISNNPISCIEEANIDLDPAKSIDIGDLTILIDHLFISNIPLGDCP